MSKELTCRDCRYWKDEGRTMACCLARNNQVFDDITPMCADFHRPDGSRPRFCRLASSVDEMAEALVRYQTGYSENFTKILVESAKKWLMEVEQ